MSSNSDAPPTLIRTRTGPTSATRRTRPWSLPSDLLAEAAHRLQAVAALYVLGYTLAALFPLTFLPEYRAKFFSEPTRWMLGPISVAGGVALAVIASHPRISPLTKLRAGLLFEIVGSFGIAAAQYQSILSPIVYVDLGAWDFGLSWVAVWVLLCGVLVPMPAAITMATATLSLAAVPITYGAGVALGLNVALGPGQFMFSLIFPYIIVLLMVYGSSRVVSRLGTAVREARDMGSYRLVERLGAGGMGEVWRAEHRMLARPAAIKLIRPEVLGATSLDSATALRRFEREAQATALLRSVHTVELYDYGMADDGTFYYVMELLDGFDLNELVERFGPLPPERAVNYLRQMCDSLAEAHEAGLVHRDIKPANMYACRSGREVDVIKVLDFGMVKQGGPAADGADTITGDHGSAGGTPAYMSPEQAIGDERTDARTDIYSLGCVAYWLLTGTHVFQGRTPMETMMHHVHKVPDPPSARVRQRIPVELEAIVLACLAKDPDARPQTADDLANRLAELPSQVEWTPMRAREWWDKHRPRAGPVTIPHASLGATP